MSSTESEDNSLLQHYKEVLIQTFSGTIPVSFKNVHEPVEITEYAYLRSLMLEPRNPLMWNALALVYLTLSRLDEAEDAIRESLDLDTSNPWTWRLWGDVLLCDNNLREAEIAFRMSLELEPRDTDVLYELLLLQIARGARQQALDTLGRLMELSPNNQNLWDSYTKCFSNGVEECLLDSCKLRNNPKFST